MRNFVFHNPTKIIFGEGEIKKLQREIPKDQRVLIIFGGGSIKKNGVYDQVRQALSRHTVFEFGGIEPNPEFDTLMTAAALAKKEKVDFILAVGGGSVVDGSKFIAAASCYEGDNAWGILERKVLIREALPLGVVLTLPATGSESNMGTVVSRKATHDKLAMMHPLLFPRFAVLDPSTTYTLPERQSANGIVDAFVHVMEQYLTIPAGAGVQDRLAEGLLNNLVEYGARWLEEPNNYETRANIMWSATLALNGLIGSGAPQDWSTHMIGHELTSFFGIDHAQTLAVVLPAMLKERQEAKKAKLLQYGERVWGIVEGSDEERMGAAIEKTEAFFQSLGIPTRLKDHGVAAEQIDAVIENLIRHGFEALGEDGAITPEVARRVLQLAL